MSESDKVSAMDAAVAKARAAAAARAAKAPKAADSSSGESGVKRPRLTDDEKVARDKAKAEDREIRKAARDVVRAERLALKANEKKAPHMSKVEKAASKLPGLSDRAQHMLDDITTNFTASDVAVLAAHLQHFNRVGATQRALNQKVSVGDTVRIVCGDARYIGRTGTVDKAQRIRCYIALEGVNKPVYLFTSDVEVVDENEMAATGTDD